MFTVNDSLVFTCEFDRVEQYHSNSYNQSLLGLSDNTVTSALRNSLFPVAFEVPQWL